MVMLQTLRVWFYDWKRVWPCWTLLGDWDCSYSECGKLAGCTCALDVVVGEVSCGCLQLGKELLWLVEGHGLLDQL